MVVMAAGITSLLLLAAGTDISAQYLQPQSQWPAMHPLATEDVAPLPPSIAVDQALSELGEYLFFDADLSFDRTVSCGSCHMPEQHFADNRRISPGVGGAEGIRTTLMLRNVALWDVLFWDGRTHSLEALVEEPLRAEHEMASTPELAVERVRENLHYRALFDAAYTDDEITWSRIQQAMAEFMRGLPSPPTPYEDFMQAIYADDFASAAAALSEQQIKGLHLFRGKAGCVQCHSGALLSDQKLHNIGLTFYQRRKYEDLGAYLITGNAKDVGRFRTPSLRHVAERGPWMHNGLFTDLLGTIRMYSHGGFHPKPRKDQVDDPLFPQTSELLQPFELSAEEERALLAFLQAL